MLSLRFSSFIFAAFTFLLTFCNCTDPVEGINKNTADTKMPENNKPAKVALTDLNCWTEGGVFYAAAIVDSEEFVWKRFWVELEILDANSQLVKVKNDSFSVVPAHSHATPPRGRTSFFWSWPLSILSGTPDTVRLHTARAVDVNPGAILLVSNQNGVRIIKGTEQDSTQEVSWNLTGIVENPLQFSATEPAIDLLLYGFDNKLWFCQSLGLNSDTAIVKSSNWGPMMPGEKRQFGLSISYEALPELLRQQKIGKVDILGFEKR